MLGVGLPRRDAYLMMVVGGLSRRRTSVDVREVGRRLLVCRLLCREER